MRKQVVFLLVMMLSVYVSVALAASDYDGWWYDQLHPGSGISLQVNGDKMFLAIFGYAPELSSLSVDPDFQFYQATWYMSAPTYDAASGEFIGTIMFVNSGGVRSLQDLGPGDLYFTSQIENAEYFPMGMIHISFMSTDEATVTMNLYGQTQMFLITKFMPHISPGYNDPRVRGWWYCPQIEGTGLFMEASGNTLFGTYYFYLENESGDGKRYPVWMSFVADLSPSSSHFDPVNMAEWFDGSTIGTTPYREPRMGSHHNYDKSVFSVEGYVRSNKSITLNFINNDTGVMGSFDFVPFVF